MTESDRIFAAAAGPQNYPTWLYKPNAQNAMAIAWVAYPCVLLFILWGVTCAK